MSGFEIPAWLVYTGVGVSAASTVAAGAESRKQAKYQQKVLDSQGEEAAAIAQRRANVERRRAEIQASRAKAVAAATGGATDDPGVVDTLNTLDAQGEYNALSQLYTGNTRRSSMRSRGNAAVKAGRGAYNQSILSATGTIIDGASTASELYGTDSATIRRRRNLSANTMPTGP